MNIKKRNAYSGPLVLLTILVFTLPLSAQHIMWKEKDSRIIHETVCYNFEKSSRDYRNCRIEARSYFKKQCKKYRELSYRSKTSGKFRYSKSKDKFCYSSRTYMILG